MRAVKRCVHVVRLARKQRFVSFGEYQDNAHEMLHAHFQNEKKKRLPSKDFSFWLLGHFLTKAIEQSHCGREVQQRKGVYNSFDSSNDLDDLLFMIVPANIKASWAPNTHKRDDPRRIERVTDNGVCLYKGADCIRKMLMVD